MRVPQVSLLETWDSDLNDEEGYDDRMPKGSSGTSIQAISILSPSAVISGPATPPLAEMWDSDHRAPLFSRSKKMRICHPDLRLFFASRFLANRSLASRPLANRF
jgi:hypothetical protein